MHFVKGLKSSILGFSIVCALFQAHGVGSSDDKKVNRDPDLAQIVTSDIDNFWRAYDAGKKDYCLGVFQREYFDKSSPGLKAFKEIRIDQCSFVETLATHPRYFASIRESTLRIQSMKGRIKESFRKFKSLYDDAVFPNVYFVIGCLNSGGTVSDSGLLIGAEMYGRTSNTPEDELSDWLKQVVKPVDNVPYIVAHELIHYQQKYPAGERTLLREAIKEGSCDFIGELISGKQIDQHVHDYANPRERELWTEFKSEMHSTNLTNWLYNANSTSKDRPADLGYYIGYQICAAYYQAAKDKKQAIKDILEIKDFDKFLNDSGYNPTGHDAR